MKIIVDSNTYKDIPTLLFHPERKKNLPLVIFCHGFNNDKYEGSNLSLKLAQEGYAVLCFDMDRHGVRYDGYMDHIKSDVDFLTVLFTIIEHSHKDIDLLIRALADDPRVNTGKIGLVGYSLGANLCNYELVNRNDISACVSILGSPKFVDLMTYTMEKNDIDELRTTEEKKLLSYVQRLDPVESLRNEEVDCAWLMINGEKDDNIPMKFSKELYLEIKDTWHSSIELMIEDEYHHVSNTMIDSAVNWIKKHLT